MVKKLLSCLAIAACLFVLLQACKKNKASTQKQQAIYVTLTNDSIYQYDLGGFGDEEGASITQQAMHYDTSKIDRGFTAIYKYKPASGYVGTDEVQLKSARGSDGESANTKIIITNIKFTITR